MQKTYRCYQAMIVPLNKGWKNIENESEGAQIEMEKLKEENKTLKARPEDKQGRKWDNLSE